MWKTSNSLKYNEAEMRWRAARAHAYRKSWFHGRYADELALMTATEPSASVLPQRLRAKKMELLNRALSKKQNKWGVRGMPVFTALGYFRRVTTPCQFNVPP